MRLSLYEFQTGAETLGGHRVVYDVANDTAAYGEAHVEGHALVWQLDDTPEEAEGALLSRRIQIDPFAEWVVRCDRIDFPPGGIAYTHTHPGPGIRYLLHGTIDIHTEGHTASYGPGGAWFESGPDPVLAEASQHQPTAFVRVADPARRVGREAHDPLRRSCRRGSAEAPEAHRLPRAPAAPDVRTGGRLLVDQLVVHGVDIAFGVPGESYLAVLDALYDAPIRFVACRHEVGAANMADAYGKLTGRPGICMVTRGPGATHAAGGIHTAFQDSTPLILLIGQVGRDMMGREAFQEIDYRHMFGPMAKWVEQIDDPDRIPELVSRAFHVATVRPPGPGRARAARRTCSSRSPTSPTRSPATVIRVHPDPARRRARESDARRRRAAARRRRRSAVERRGARRPHRLVHRERAPGRVGLAPPGLRRQQLGRLRRAPRRSAPIPGSRSGCATPTCCS